MRAIRLLALVAVTLSAQAADADFIVSGYGYPGPVDDVYEYYALNGGANRTGTRVQSTDVTMLNEDEFGMLEFGHGFVFKFVDNTGGAPADTAGVALYHAGGNNPSALFRGHSDRTFINILGDEPAADPTLYNRTFTNPDPEFHSNYNIPVYRWEQAGSLPGGVDATALSNGGRGALIAVAVVEHGDPVEVGGTVVGLTGAPTTFDVFLPEPSIAAFVCIATGGLLLHRCRAAR